MSSFDLGCATWNARLKVLPIALSIFFPKSPAGSGSKTDIIFFFLYPKAIKLYHIMVQVPS
jgi:hypothetical protein